jgi:trk system potassium uptake protein TrkA
MRIVFIGASALAVEAARALIDDGHEVVIVDEDESRLEALEEMDLDCGLVHGDGSRPAVLSELGPGNTDFLFCMSNSDQDNILAALAGKQLGFGQVVAKIEDPDFRGLCAELGLEDVLIPTQETANAITDRVAGITSVDLAPLMETGIRFFSFAARSGHAGPVSELGLPDGARLLAVTRDGETELAAEDVEIQEHDTVYVICFQDHVKDLRSRFIDETGSEGSSGDAEAEVEVEEAKDD